MREVFERLIRIPVDDGFILSPVLRNADIEGILSIKKLF